MQTRTYLSFLGKIAQSSSHINFKIYGDTALIIRYIKKVQHVIEFYHLVLGAGNFHSFLQFHSGRVYFNFIIGFNQGEFDIALASCVNHGIL